VLAGILSCRRTVEPLPRKARSWSPALARCQFFPRLLGRIYRPARWQIRDLQLRPVAMGESVQVPAPGPFPGDAAHQAEPSAAMPPGSARGDEGSLGRCWAEHRDASSSSASRIRADSRDEAIPGAQSNSTRWPLPGTTTKPPFGKGAASPPRRPLSRRLPSSRRQPRRQESNTESGNRWAAQN
jgi:hypothetical protein